MQASDSTLILLLVSRKILIFSCAVTELQKSYLYGVVSTRATSFGSLWPEREKILQGKGLGLYDG